MAVVVVTGSSSGIGLATARHFAREGHEVYAGVRNPAAATDLAAGAEAPKPRLHVLTLDVDDDASVARAAREVLDRAGRIDVLVNNAGIGVLGALEVVDDAQLRQVFDTNVFGAVAVTRAVLPHMREQHAGRVIFMNAIGGVLTTAFLGAYCASKHALDCIAAVFDLELRPFGIRVSSVYPSAFRTAMAENNTIVTGEGTPYHQATQRYHQGLSERIRNGPTDLGPVVNAVVDAATSPDPPLRYPVAPHLAEVLAPAFKALEQLHERELSAS